MGKYPKSYAAKQVIVIPSIGKHLDKVLVIGLPVPETTLPDKGLWWTLMDAKELDERKK